MFSYARSGAGVAAVAVAVAVASGSAWGQNSTYVVTGSDDSPPSHATHTSQVERSQVETRQMEDPVRSSVQIVTRKTAYPSATVSRRLRQQPTYPDLVEVQVGVQSVLVDPYSDPCKPWGCIDENHWIRQAKTQADVPRPLPTTTIVHGSPRRPSTEQPTTQPEPAAIIPIPKQLQEQDPAPVEPKKTAPQHLPMPEPDFKDRDPRLMAEADK